MSQHNGPIKPGFYWCECCERFVVNNAACRRTHNETITHKANAAKYEKRKKQERLQNEAANREVQEQLAIIKAKATQNYLKNDVQKQNDRSALDEHVNDLDEIERAKELYGEEFYEQEVKEGKQKLDKTEIYNDFMKQLPTHILAKYRQPINKFQ